MKCPKFLFFPIFLYSLSSIYTVCYAQLGFCKGNSGDPIFYETFGSGTGFGPELSADQTTYTYINGRPDDGQYTLTNRMGMAGWQQLDDHTPDDENGKAMLVNAAYAPGEFYTRVISGLCENTSYEFSAWLVNILKANGCGGNGKPVNVSFQIWDETQTELLASGDTGDILQQNEAQWQQYALVFSTLPGQNTVNLKMVNNGRGGCGNDLAIDDIVFKSCGDSVIVTDAQNRTEVEVFGNDLPFTIELFATPDYSVYTQHAYQWQRSTDGVEWFSIEGATFRNYLATNVS